MKQYKPEKLSVLEQRGGSFAMSKMFVGSIEERRKAFNTFIKDNSDDSKTVLRHRKIIQLKYLEKKEKANKKLTSKEEDDEYMKALVEAEDYKLLDLQAEGEEKEEWMWVCKSDTFKNDDDKHYKLCNKFGEPLNNVDVINTIWDKAEKEVIDGTGMTLTLANNPGHHAIHDLLTMSLGIYDLFFLYTVYLFDATSKEQEKDIGHKRRLIKDQIVHAYNYDIVAKQKKELEKYITQFNELQEEYRHAQTEQEIKKPNSLRMTYYKPITGVEAIHAYMQLKKDATKIKEEIWSLEQIIPPEGLDDYRTDEQKTKWDQSQNEMTIRIDQRNKIQQLKKMEVDAYDILKHVRIKNENEHQWEKELNKEVLRQKKFTLLNQMEVVSNNIKRKLTILKKFQKIIKEGGQDIGNEFYVGDEINRHYDNFSEKSLNYMEDSARSVGSSMQSAANSLGDGTAAMVSSAIGLPMGVVTGVAGGIYNGTAAGFKMIGTGVKRIGDGVSNGYETVANGANYVSDYLNTKQNIITDEYTLFPKSITKGNITETITHFTTQLTKQKLLGASGITNINRTITDNVRSNDTQNYDLILKNIPTMKEESQKYNMETDNSIKILQRRVQSNLEIPKVFVVSKINIEDKLIYKLDRVKKSADVKKYLELPKDYCDLVDKAKPAFFRFRNLCNDIRCLYKQIFEILKDIKTINYDMLYTNQLKFIKIYRSILYRYNDNNHTTRPTSPASPPRVDSPPPTQGAAPLTPKRRGAIPIASSSTVYTDEDKEWMLDIKVIFSHVAKQYIDHIDENDNAKWKDIRDVYTFLNMELIISLWKEFKDDWWSKCKEKDQKYIQILRQVEYKCKTYDHVLKEILEHILGLYSNIAVSHAGTGASAAPPSREDAATGANKEIIEHILRQVFVTKEETNNDSKENWAKDIDIKRYTGTTGTNNYTWQGIDDCGPGEVPRRRLAEVKSLKRQNLELENAVVASLGNRCSKGGYGYKWLATNTDPDSNINGYPFLKFIRYSGVGSSRVNVDSVDNVHSLIDAGRFNAKTGVGERTSMRTYPDTLSFITYYVIYLCDGEQPNVLASSSLNKSYENITAPTQTWEANEKVCKIARILGLKEDTINIGYGFEYKKGNEEGKLLYVEKTQNEDDHLDTITVYTDIEGHYRKIHKDSLLTIELTHFLSATTETASASTDKIIQKIIQSVIDNWKANNHKLETKGSSNLLSIVDRTINGDPYVNSDELEANHKIYQLGGSSYSDMQSGVTDLLRDKVTSKVTSDLVGKYSRGKDSEAYKLANAKDEKDRTEKDKEIIKFAERKSRSGGIFTETKEAFLKGVKSGDPVSGIFGEEGALRTGLSMTGDRANEFLSNRWSSVSGYVYNRNTAFITGGIVIAALYKREYDRIRAEFCKIKENHWACVNTPAIYYNGETFYKGGSIPKLSNEVSEHMKITIKQNQTVKENYIKVDRNIPNIWDVIHTKDHSVNIRLNLAGDIDITDTIKGDYIPITDKYGDYKLINNCLVYKEKTESVYKYLYRVKRKTADNTYKLKWVIVQTPSDVDEKTSSIISLPSSLVNLINKVNEEDIMKQVIRDVVTAIKSPTDDSVAVPPAIPSSPSATEAEGEGKDEAAAASPHNDVVDDLTDTMKPTTSFKLLGIIKDPVASPPSAAAATSTLKRNFKDYIIGYHTQVGTTLVDIKKKLIELKDSITNKLGNKTKHKPGVKSFLNTQSDELVRSPTILDKPKVKEILNIYIDQYETNKKEENPDELQRVLNLKVTNDLYNYSETVFLNHYGNKNIELITIKSSQRWSSVAITEAITVGGTSSDSTELKTLIINIHTPKVPSLTSFWDQLTIKTGGNGSLDLAEVGLKSLAIKGSKNDYHINRFEKLIENITDNMFKWMDRNLPVNELHFPEVPLDLRVLLWRYIDEYGIGFFNESRGVSDPNSLQKRYNYYHRYALYQDESTWMSLLGEYNPSVQPKGYIQRATKWIGLEGAGWGRTLAIGSAAVGAGLLLSGPLGWAAAAAAAVASGAATNFIIKKAAKALRYAQGAHCLPYLFNHSPCLTNLIFRHNETLMGPDLWNVGKNILKKQIGKVYTYKHPKLTAIQQFNEKKKRKKHILWEQHYLKKEKEKNGSINDHYKKILYNKLSHADKGHYDRTIQRELKNFEIPGKMASPKDAFNKARENFKKIWVKKMELLYSKYKDPNDVYQFKDRLGFLNELTEYYDNYEKDNFPSVDTILDIMFNKWLNDQFVKQNKKKKTRMDKKFIYI